MIEMQLTSGHIGWLQIFPSSRSLPNSIWQCSLTTLN